MLNGDNGIIDGYVNRDPDYYDDDNDGTDLNQVRQSSDRASQQFVGNPEGGDDDEENCE